MAPFVASRLTETTAGCPCSHSPSLAPIRGWSGLDESLQALSPQPRDIIGMKLFKRLKSNSFKETLCLPCLPWHLCSVSVAREDQRGHTHHPWFWLLLEYPLFLCWDRIWTLFWFSSDHPACALGPWRGEEKNSNIAAWNDVKDCPSA